MGTPSLLGHMDRVATTMPSQAHAGAAQEAPDIGQWEGQDVPLVRPSSCNVKGGIPSSRRYLPTYLISNGFVASAIFMLYTRKINPIFSDIQNRILDFEIAALDMMNSEWSYIFPRSRINLPFVVSFIFLGDIGETKLIREATLKGHISGSRRGIPISRIGLEPPWSQLNLGSIKRL